MAGKAQFPMEQSPAGEFRRQRDAFREWVTADGRSVYPAVPGRYHLYVSWACPWAHRTIIVRKLKQLRMIPVDGVEDLEQILFVRRDWIVIVGNVFSCHRGERDNLR